MTVIIGMDPHKRSATIGVLDEHETILAVGRYGTDKDGYAVMLAAGRTYSDRVWAVEGCNGIGRHVAHRLVHKGQGRSEASAAQGPRCPRVCGLYSDLARADRRHCSLWNGSPGIQVRCAYCPMRARIGP